MYALQMGTLNNPTLTQTISELWFMLTLSCIVRDIVDNKIIDNAIYTMFALSADRAHVE